MDQTQGLAVVVDALVGIVQAAQHVGGHAQRVLNRNGAPDGVGVVDDPANRAPGDVLHGDVVGAAVLAEVVDLHDVGMIEQGLDPGLVDKHGLDLAIAQQLFVDPFDDQGLLEAAGAGFSADKDLGHPASGEELGHLVGANTLRHP